MNKILDVVEDIKQNITDNQYKIIMDSLMEIHKTEEKKINDESSSCKCIALLNWLDTKLELTDDSSDVIKRKDLYKYIILCTKQMINMTNSIFAMLVIEDKFIPIEKISKIYYRNGFFTTKRKN